ncbi:hypothetical protein ABGB16_26575 [Micromonospora sp. B11E3]|uniref:hypothetical protein n=1 Tax=unclassified Micromonospora TaxID=2617518 RepID=UPI00325D3B8B
MKLVETADGGVAAWRLSKESGGWLPVNNLIDTLLFPQGGDVDQLTRDEFIQTVEHDRGYYLSGEGPIFALYETIKAIADLQMRERRYPSPEEDALVKGLRRRTFVMFEEELQQAGDPGADPTIASS